MTQPIAIRYFGGEQPALDARALPPEKSQLSRDMRLGYGRLEPLSQNQALGISLGAATQSIYLYNRDANAGAGFWLAWDTPVDALESPIADDVHGRVYWSGDGAPKMSVAAIISTAPPYPSNSYLLGVPAPTTTCSVSVDAGADPEALLVSVVYAITYVSAYGEESAPSIASAVVSRPDGHGTTLTSLPPAPTGNYNVATKRIYRSSGSDYLLLAEVAVATASYVDTIPDSDLGSPLESIDFDMPDAALQGLTQHPGGFMVAYFDNVLCFSMAYLPHAWPTAYRLTTQKPITGIAITASGIVVGTEAQPYLCAGSTPEAMQLLPIDTPNACVGPRSMVDMGEFVLYASPDGLVAAGGTESKVVTEQLFTRKQWQALVPSSIHAYRYDGNYLALHTGGAFMLNTDSGELCSLSDSAEAAFYDAIRDALYLSSAGVLSSFDSDAALRTSLWRSKIARSSDQVPYAAYRVEAASYPVTLRLYGDTALIAEQVVASAAPGRLPSANRYHETYLELDGNTTVTQVQLALTMTELQ